MSGYGFQDSASVGSNAGKFGLNSGALVTKFEFNPNGGKDGTPSECLDVTVVVDGKEFRKRFYPVGKIYKGGSEVQPGSEDYDKLFEKEMKIFNASTSDIAIALVKGNEEAIKGALNAAPINSFKQFIETLEKAVKLNNPAWATTPVDVFLQYQWAPSGTNTRTFLEFSGTVKHGRVITHTTGEEFKEVRTATSLKYVSEAGTVHPITRGEWFMESNFANPVGDTTEQAGANMNEAPTQENTGSMPSGW